ncbi:unnamed protein product [Echinostoma caproni]|uniref:Amidase domain-containing protein n=1 Tax=Echinostoma caproni TaxID=27848 RepID=A0A183BAB9_9TREM|nr:unnamed protein product [Echinostoma caproni]
MDGVAVTYKHWEVQTATPRGISCLNKGDNWHGAYTGGNCQRDQRPEYYHTRFLPGNLKVSTSPSKGFEGAVVAEKNSGIEVPAVLISLYKALVQPHLEYYVPAWPLNPIRDQKAPANVQRRFTSTAECLGSEYTIEEILEARLAVSVLSLVKPGMP